MADDDVRPEFRLDAGAPVQSWKLRTAVTASGVLVVLSAIAMRQSPNTWPKVVFGVTVGGVILCVRWAWTSLQRQITKSKPR